MSTPVYSTPEKAERAFYAAFQAGELKAMMDVWSDDESVVCIHPGAPRLQGIEQVREGWRQILENSTGLEFVLTDVQATEDEWLSIHVVREEISIEGQLTGVMLATNIYHRVGDGWRMMLHHASPEPEQFYDELDMAYEDVVLH
ncbi:MAG: nuclear transport factor 2 family protein [Pseudomonadota bacterium]